MPQNTKYLIKINCATLIFIKNMVYIYIMSDRTYTLLQDF